MLTKREPSRPAHFEYCPIFGAWNISCSTVLRIHPPGIPNLRDALSSVLLISS